jgi:hypothetical protein
MGGVSGAELGQVSFGASLAGRLRTDGLSIGTSMHAWFAFLDIFQARAYKIGISPVMTPFNIVVLRLWWVYDIGADSGRTMSEQSHGPTRTNLTQA